SAARRTLRLGFRSDAERELFERVLVGGQNALRGHGFAATGAAASDPSNELPAHVELLPAMAYETTDALEEAVLASRLDVGLQLREKRFLPDGDFSADWEVFYRRDSWRGREGVRLLQRVTLAHDEAFLG